MQVIFTHILSHIVSTMSDQNQINSFAKIIFIFLQSSPNFLKTDYVLSNVIPINYEIRVTNS